MEHLSKSIYPAAIKMIVSLYIYWCEKKKVKISSGKEKQVIDILWNYYMSRNVLLHILDISNGTF